MIEAHTFDAWTLPTEHARVAFGRLMMLGGMAAPLFLFLAGVAVSLGAAAHQRRGASVADASRRVERRGLQIFGYGMLFRLQSFILGGFARPQNLLKVDILNVMGPAVALTAALWGLASSRRGQAFALALATLAMSCLSPWIRQTPMLAWLPDPLEWYLRPPPGQGTFTLFPWAAFTLAGGVLGVALDGALQSAWWRQPRLQACVAGTGLTLIAVGAWSSYQPTLFEGAKFWTTSPAFFAERVGLILLLVALSAAWAARPWRAATRSSALETMGAGSLFVYWVHVELVYGLASRPLRHQLTLEGCAVAAVGLAVVMYGLLLGWNASKPTRSSVRQEALKLFKSDGWVSSPVANR